MEIVARFRLDQTYYEEFYAAWRRHRSRWRLFAWPITIVLLAAGIAAIVYLPNDLALGIGLIAGGIWQGFSTIRHKSKWIAERMGEIPADLVAEIIFREDCIESKTMVSESKLSLTLVSEFALATDGFFLCFPGKRSLYLPRASIDSDKEYSALLAMLSETAKGQQQTSASR